MSHCFDSIGSGSSQGYTQRTPFGRPVTRLAAFCSSGRTQLPPIGRPSALEVVGCPSDRLGPSNCYPVTPLSVAVMQGTHG